MHTRVNGDALDKTSIAEATTATTKYGRSAKAKIRTKHGETKTINTKGTPLVVKAVDTKPQHVFASFLSLFGNRGD